MTNKEVIEGTAEQIFKCDDLELRKVYVEKWKCNVYIKQLSAEEVDYYNEQIKDKDFSYKRCAFIIAALCDKEGNKLFKSDQKTIDALNKKSIHVLNFLIKEIDETVLKTQEDIEEIAKNS